MLACARFPVFTKLAVDKVEPADTTNVLSIDNTKHCIGLSVNGLGLRVPKTIGFEGFHPLLFFKVEMRHVLFILFSCCEFKIKFTFTVLCL